VVVEEEGGGGAREDEEQEALVSIGFEAHGDIGPFGTASLVASRAASQLQ
jgi:hypothetical protein